MGAPLTTKVRVCGIDWATTPARRAAVILETGGARGAVTLCDCIAPVSDEIAAALCVAPDLDVVAVDTPFGWPRDFAQFVVAWSPTGACPDGVPDSEAFRYRATDRVICRELSKRPLSVSSDLIGLSARAWTDFVHRRGLTYRIDVGVSGRGDGKPALVEVYPAASLKAFCEGWEEVRAEGYKTKPAVRRAVLAGLLREFRIESAARQVERMGSDAGCDAMDALVAALTGLCYLDRLDGWTVRRPRGDELEAARWEGWIFFPAPRQARAFEVDEQQRV